MDENPIHYVRRELEAIKGFDIDLGGYPISPQETMKWSGDESNYYVHAKSAISLIRTVLAMVAKDKESIRTILDFPCGHGRILRGLRTEFPNADIVAADIDLRGVNFCAETFGAIPFKSSTNLDEIKFDRKFDLIWVGSLFTHLSEDDWLPFLRLLAGSLADEGVFIFTYASDFVAWLCEHKGDALSTCDQDEIDDALRGFKDNGFGFMRYRGAENYGRTLASVLWVSDLIRREFQACRVVLHGERAWGARQNTVALQKHRVEEIVTSRG